jgi:hypothetical protein
MASLVNREGFVVLNCYPENAWLKSDYDYEYEYDKPAEWSVSD